MKDLGQDMWCPGRVLKQAAPEYKPDHMKNMWAMAGNISEIVLDYNVLLPHDLNMAKNTGLTGE
jgi:hypothetical protein